MTRRQYWSAFRTGIHRHPLGWHVAVVVMFSVCVLGVVLTTKMLADASDTIIACSYSYSAWGECQPTNRHYRTVTGMSPDGCVQVQAPVLTESCNYTAPKCSYTYSAWSECQPEGKHYRTVTGMSPLSCVGTPETVGSCTYTQPTISCTYTYSDWGACQSTNQQSRTVVSKSPAGCEESTKPETTRSCTYTSSSSSSSVSTSTETSVAPQCVYTYSAWGSCQENGVRKRSLASKSPLNCEEYTHPVLEQSCIYDASTSSTSWAPTSTTTTESSPQSSTDFSSVASVTSESSSPVTPAFVFTNIADGLSVHDTFEIRGEVENADGVEFFLVPVGSNTYKYIGTATSVAPNVWHLFFHSKEFPNGDFYVRVKVKNRYGEYGGSQRKISINNGNQSLIDVSSTQKGFQSFEISTEDKLAILDTFEKNWQIPEQKTEESTHNPEQERTHILNYCFENTSQCQTNKDTDRDGLSDLDEIRYGSNPLRADTDLDGFLDGDEVKNGFDPVKYSGGDKSDKIVFESPKTAGEVRSDVYKVESVALQGSAEGQKTLHITGIGLPNSFVTLYIYSDPIVLTVKTDSAGNWTYDLDKTLEDGKHQVYVAVTDNVGKITAKSEPIAFVKTAEAVSVIPTAAATPLPAVAPISQSRSLRDVLLLIGIAVAGLAAALVVIGLVWHRHHADSNEVLPRV